MKAWKKKPATFEPASRAPQKPQLGGYAKSIARRRVNEVKLPVGVVSGTRRRAPDAGKNVLGFDLAAGDVRAHSLVLRRLRFKFPHDPPLLRP